MLREPKPILDADQTAIDPLAFIASHEDLLNRFIDLTGYDASQLRAQAEHPEFFVAVLDFILANGPGIFDLAASWRCRRRRSGWRGTLWQRRPAFQ